MSCFLLFSSTLWHSMFLKSLPSLPTTLKDSHFPISNLCSEFWSDLSQHPYFGAPLLVSQVSFSNEIALFLWFLWFHWLCRSQLCSFLGNRAQNHRPLNFPPFQNLFCQIEDSSLILLDWSWTKYLPISS